MSLIDTSQWKEFSLKNLGFVCFHGQRLNQSNREEGKIPFVTAGFQNHGVTQYIGNNRPTYHKAITIDMFGNCFFQPDDCAGDDNVYFFVNNKVSDFGKIFISACIVANISEIYSYAKQFRQQNANALTIKLPATPSGAPDWAYMDSFMGKILEEEEAAAEQLTALAPESEADGHSLDVSGWKAFRIGDMFAVEPMPCKLSKGDLDNGHIPVYSSDSENYGILGYTSNDATYKITASKPFFVVFGDHTCNMSIVHVDFCVADNVKVLFPKIYISEDALLFLLTAWKKNIKKLGYARHWSIAKDTDIFLPAMPDGQPDWAWMEQYMQQQLDKVEPLSEHLSKLVQ